MMRSIEQKNNFKRSLEKDFNELRIRNLALDICIKRVDSFLLSNPRNTEIRGMLLTGDSGVGKSSAMELVEEAHPELTFKFCKLPTTGKEKAAVSAVLEGLGDKQPEKINKTAEKLKDRIAERVLLDGIDVLIMDEVHHLVKPDKKGFHWEMSEWVKTLICDIPCLVIFVGMPIAYKLFLANEQLDRRVKKHHTLMPFKWDGGACTKDFAYSLHRLEQTIGVSETVTQKTKIAKRIWLLSKGRIGYMHNFMLDAANNMIDRDGDKLSLADFEQTFEDNYSRALDENGEVVIIDNPFTYLIEMEEQKVA